ncbi:hypothetical protein V865_002332 [Kwoniella europaea PYCC6329]|uniref:Polycomb protein EED n=1 Tax=Kwoniella europaea PYCC6329 TaxID=1423913 RepID=A0AAX4KE12_9TREE
MNAVIDLTRGYPTPASEVTAPQSPTARSESETPSHQPSEPPPRWYKRRPDKGRVKSGHPYVCEAMVMQIPSETPYRFEDCKFWPFVGPLNPWQLPKSVGWESWDDFDGTIALCAKGKVVLARCRDDDPWQVIWELEIDDYPYAVAWTYHPFTCYPLIATAGEKGLIYIINAISRRCVRTLRGHGGDITSLTFHPLHPHILASTSYDKTTRIWNILGSDLIDFSEGEFPSMNFPMGDADEGNCLFAILAGDFKGGHRGYVAAANFHPTRNAIATVGLDRHVKIWPLPEFPKPTLSPLPPPRGYRAKIIYQPIFSTTRLHEEFVDNVEWLNEYILITRSRKEFKIWQWLGFSRYFTENDPLPRNLDPISQDYMDSGSFMLISKYDIGSDCWAMKMSFHRPFVSQPQDEQEEEDNLVYGDPLIGLVTHSSKIPEIAVLNPLLAPPEDVPEPTDELRPKSRREREGSTASGSDIDEDDEDDEVVSIVDSCSDSSMNHQNDTIDLTMNEDQDAVTDRRVDGDSTPAEPWRLIPTEFQPIRQKHAKKGYRIYNSSTNVCNVAISPRGAKWIVGVGEPGTVFVWKIDPDWKME